MKDPLRSITKHELHQHNQRLIAEKEALLGENSQLKNDKKLILLQAVHLGEAVHEAFSGIHSTVAFADYELALARIQRLAGGFA